MDFYDAREKVGFGEKIIGTRGGDEYICTKTEDSIFPSECLNVHVLFRGDWKPYKEKVKVECEGKTVLLSRESAKALNLI